MLKEHWSYTVLGLMLVYKIRIVQFKFIVFLSFCHNYLLPIIENSVTVSTDGDITFGVLGTI